MKMVATFTPFSTNTSKSQSRMSLGKNGNFPQTNGKDACASNSDLIAWRNRVNEMTPLKDMPPMNCPNLIDVMSTFMYLVTGAHNHVGSVAAELEDPCFCPWAWRERTTTHVVPRATFSQKL